MHAPPPNRSNQEVFSVRWRGHGPNMSSHLATDYYGRKAFADMTLATEDGSVRIECHRLVLAAGSAYFRHILKDVQTSSFDAAAECACGGGVGEAVIILPGVSARLLRHLVRYMYFGEADVEPQLFEEFVSTAKNLGLKGVLDKTWTLDHSSNSGGGGAAAAAAAAAAGSAASALAYLSNAAAYVPRRSASAAAAGGSSSSSHHVLPAPAPQPPPAILPDAGLPPPQLHNGLSILAQAAITKLSSTSRLYDNVRSPPPSARQQQAAVSRPLFPQQQPRRRPSSESSTATSYHPENDENDPLNTSSDHLRAINLSTKQSDQDQQQQRGSTGSYRPLLSIPDPSMLSRTFSSSSNDQLHELSPSPTMAIDMTTSGGGRLAAAAGVAPGGGEQPDSPSSAAAAAAAAFTAYYNAVGGPYVKTERRSSHGGGGGGGVSPLNQTAVNFSSLTPESQMDKGEDDLAAALASPSKVKRKRKRPSAAAAAANPAMSGPGGGGENDLRANDKTWKSRQPRTCNHCSRVFSNKFNLKQHVMNMHTPGGAVHCELCKKRVKNKWYLRRHQVTHHNAPLKK